MLQTNLGLRKPSKTAVSFREFVIPMRIHNKGKKAYTRVDVGRSRVKETQAAWVEFSLKVEEEEEEKKKE